MTPAGEGRGHDAERGFGAFPKAGPAAVTSTLTADPTEAPSPKVAVEPAADILGAKARRSGGRPTADNLPSGSLVGGLGVSESQSEPGQAMVADDVMHANCLLRSKRYARHDHPVLSLA